MSPPAGVVSLNSRPGWSCRKTNSAPATTRPAVTHCSAGRRRTHSNSRATFSALQPAGAGRRQASMSGGTATASVIGGNEGQRLAALGEALAPLPPAEIARRAGPEHQLVAEADLGQRAGADGAAGEGDGMAHTSNVGAIGTKL